MEKLQKIFFNTNNNAFSISDGEEKGIVVGIASTTDINQNGIKLAPFAFLESINTRGIDGLAGVKFFFNHDSSKAIGVIKKLLYDETGAKLHITAKLNLAIPEAFQLYENLKFGVPVGFSVGFTTSKIENLNNKIKFIRHGNLTEISATYDPADLGCEITETFNNDTTIDETISNTDFVVSYFDKFKEEVIEKIDNIEQKLSKLASLDQVVEHESANEKAVKDEFSGENNKYAFEAEFLKIRDQLANIVK